MAPGKQNPVGSLILEEEKQSLGIPGGVHTKQPVQGQMRA